MGRCFWFVLWSRKLNFSTSSRANGRRKRITCEFRIFNYSNRFTILGIIAIGISKTNGVFAISSRVSKIYAYIFTIGLYLVISSLLYQDLQQHHMKLLFHHLFLQAVENGFYLSLVCCSLS